MDLLTWIEFLAPLGLAALAIYLGFVYQINSLDRETRKEAYLDAISCIDRVMNLVEYAERVTFAPWIVEVFQNNLKRNAEATADGPSALTALEESAATPDEKQAISHLRAALDTPGHVIREPDRDYDKPRRVKSSHHRKPVDLVSPGLVLQSIERAKETLSRLGLETDWTTIGVSSATGLVGEIPAILNKVLGALMQEQEAIRVEFNLSVYRAVSVHRRRAFWWLVPTGQAVHDESREVLGIAFLRVNSTLDEAVNEITAALAGQPFHPSCVNWIQVNQSRDKAVSQAVQDIQTLRHENLRFIQKREMVPWWVGFESVVGSACRLPETTGFRDDIEISSVPRLE